MMVAKTVHILIDRAPRQSGRIATLARGQRAALQPSYSVARILRLDKRQIDPREKKMEKRQGKVEKDNR